MSPHYPTLLQGDCLEQLRHVPAGAVDMVFADLPYGVTCNKWDTCIPLAPLWAELLRVGKPRCAYVFTATQPFATALINSQPKLFRYDLVWIKKLATGHLNAKKRPLRRHELVLVFSRPSSVYNAQKSDGSPYVRGSGSPSTNYGSQIATKHPKRYDGQRYPTSILDCRSLNAQRIKAAHPTQKPVALLEWLIRTYSNEGDMVLDPTMGSGTTGVACRNTAREFIGIEQDPTYFRAACARITGNQPEAVPDQAVMPGFNQLHQGIRHEPALPAPTQR